MISAAEAMRMSLPYTNKQEKFQHFLDKYESTISNEIKDRALTGQKKHKIGARQYEDFIASYRDFSTPLYANILADKEQTELFVNYLTSFGYSCAVKNFESWTILTISW